MNQCRGKPGLQVIQKGCVPQRRSRRAEVEVVDRILGWRRQIVPTDQRLSAALAQRRIGMVIEERVWSMVQHQRMHAVAGVAVGAHPRGRRSIFRPASVLGVVDFDDVGTHVAAVEPDNDPFPLIANSLR